MIARPVRQVHRLKKPTKHKISFNTSHITQSLSYKKSSPAVSRAGVYAKKSHSSSTRCVRTACFQLLTNLEQVVIIL